jgi:hypothetical protein
MENSFLNLFCLTLESKICRTCNLYNNCDEMIPVEIKRIHILEAIKLVELKGIPETRKSTKFSLVYRGCYYPPKYIISTASKIATGKELKSGSFSGGKESNSFLIGLGFQVVESKEPNITKKAQKKTKNSKAPIDYSPNAKHIIYEFLRKIFKTVHQEYSISIKTDLEYYKGKSYYNELENVYYSIIEGKRNYSFVRKKSLQPSDFWIKDYEFLVEVDERQHFSKARYRALQAYPKNLSIGFSRSEWISLCLRLKAKDSNPIYRDEQRAWYDSLRDFIPFIYPGSKPIHRIYQDSFNWISLDPSNDKHVEIFLLKSGLKKYIRDYIDKPSATTENKRLQKSNISVQKKSVKSIGRLILTGGYDCTFPDKILNKVFSKDYDKKFNYFTTPGGFFQKTIPNSHFVSISNTKNSTAIQKFVKIAENEFDRVISPTIRKKISKRCEFLTIGFDIFSEDYADSRNEFCWHVELVGLYNTKNYKAKWTGKSYPIESQKKYLTTVNDLSSHFIELNDDRLMVLGCHDLNMFSPRARANSKPGSEKYKVNRKMHTMATEFRPNIVLQHPHTTDTQNIWLLPWKSIEKEFFEVELYAGSGRYFNQQGERSTIAKTLEKTKMGDVTSIIYSLKTNNVTKVVK